MAMHFLVVAVLSPTLRQTLLATQSGTSANTFLHVPPVATEPGSAHTPVIPVPLGKHFMDESAHCGADRSQLTAGG